MGGMDRIIKKKKWTVKRIASFIALVLFPSIGLYMLIFSVGESQIRVQSDRVTISTVTEGPFQEYIAIVGEAQPRNTFFLDAIEGGRVEKIFVEAGTMVKEGDAILKLSNTNLLLDVMFREAEFSEQSNNLRNTRLLMEQQRLQLNRDLASARYKLIDKKRASERNIKLFESKLISEEDYFKTKDEYEFLQKDLALTEESMEKDIQFREQQVAQLEISLGNMKNNLQIVRNKLKGLTILAPTSGYLTALNVESIGESKSPGERLGRIDVLDGFKVRARIDEHYISRVEKGLQGSFSLSGSDYSLEILKVYPEVNQGRFEVDMRFQTLFPQDLRRGQTLHINLSLGDLSEAVLLPRGGFYQATGGNWAYVLDEQHGRAVKKNIQLGRMNTAVFEVTSGLNPGDRVITSSYETFGNKDKIILK